MKGQGRTKSISAVQFFPFGELMTLDDALARIAKYPYSYLAVKIVKVEGMRALHLANHENWGRKRKQQ